MQNDKIIRCAIYTRKSTEEGLEQEYNTLDAQRDAGENYIKSQAREGWVIKPEHYDDGGFTGGNMERPALKRLIEDIKAGAVDVVVVYKIDRLSRSLMDFAHLVGVFDEYDVSFVSVTQHFNTKDSMGRLTLNILFSFAQFEREVIGERIRDKFAASKKKGIFMGGIVPLGYKSIDRKLRVIPEEAKQVQEIYNRFVETKSVMGVVDELNEKGYVTQRYISGTNKAHGGKPLSRPYIHRILTNPLYLGVINHKGELYPGQHEAIISKGLWDKAQAILKTDRRKRAGYSRNDNPVLLRGLIKCGCCNSTMSPSNTKQKNRRYRYYVANKAINQGYKQCDIGQLPASEIEAVVVGYIRQCLQDPKVIARTCQNIQNDDRCPSDFGFAELKRYVKNWDRFWEGLTPRERNRIVELLVDNVTVSSDEIAIDMKISGLEPLTDIDNNSATMSMSDTGDILHIRIPATIRRRSYRKMIVTPDGRNITDMFGGKGDNIDRVFIMALGKAFAWQKMLNDGVYENVRALAEDLGVEYTHVNRTLRLTLLAPDIVESVVQGTQPRTLTLQQVIRGFPESWVQQRYMFLA